MKKTKQKKYFRNVALLAIFVLFLPLVVFFVQQSQDFRQHAQAAQTYNISIQDFQFSPATITVPVGATVTWTNQSPTNHHTTTSDIQGTANSWDSGLTNPGDTFNKTFTTAGTFAFHCNVHTFMQGTVVVTAAAATTAPTIAATQAPTTPLVPSSTCLGSCPQPTATPTVNNPLTPTMTPNPTISGVIDIPTIATNPGTTINPNLPGGTDKQGFLAIIWGFILFILKLLLSLFGK